MSSPIAFAGALAAIALAAASPANAAPTEGAQAAVKYSDLDLSSAEGRATLERRIQKAAREVCGMEDAPTTGSRLPTAGMRQCYDQAAKGIDEHIARAIEKREGKS